MTKLISSWACQWGTLITPGCSWETCSRFGAFSTVLVDGSHCRFAISYFPANGPSHSPRTQPPGCYSRISSQSEQTQGGSNAETFHAHRGDRGGGGAFRRAGAGRRPAQGRNHRVELEHRRRSPRHA